MHTDAVAEEAASASCSVQQLAEAANMDGKAKIMSPGGRTDGLSSHFADLAIQPSTEKTTAKELATGAETPHHYTNTACHTVNTSMHVSFADPLPTPPKPHLPVRSNGFSKLFQQSDMTEPCAPCTCSGAAYGPHTIDCRHDAAACIRCQHGYWRRRVLVIAGRGVGILGVEGPEAGGVFERPPAPYRIQYYSRVMSEDEQLV